MTPLGGLRRALLWGAGALALAGLFELIGDSHAIAEWPSLHAVVSDIITSHSLFLDALWATVSAALVGLLVGTAVAIVFAGAAIAFPRTRRSILSVAVLVNALPLVVLGSLLISLVSAATCATVLAALGVFFVVLLPFAAGLGDGTAVRGDLFGALGATRFQRLRLLQIPTGVPLLADGIRLGIPAAVLGATLGEWFVADRGLGALLVAAMQNYEITNLWGAALIAALASVAGYGAATAVQAWCVRRFGDA